MRKLILLVLAAVLSVAALAGCHEWESLVNKTGHFNYKQKGAPGVCYVTGLTELGVEQQHLFLSGYQTWVLGFDKENETLYSDRLEKFYAQKNFSVSTTAVFDGCPNLQKIFIVDPDAKMHNTTMPSLTDLRTKYDVYVANRFYDTTVKGITFDAENGFKRANVCYRRFRYSNYDDVYFIDDVEYGAKLSFIPPPPFILIAHTMCL